MGNNPILYNDPLGDKIKGVDKKSGSRILNQLIKTFNGNKGIQGLFKLSSDGMTLSQISKDDLAKAIVDDGVEVDSDEYNLLMGYVDAINSNDNHIVEMAKSSEPLSNTSISILKGKKTKAGSSFQTGKDINEFGGGVNFSSQQLKSSHTIVLMDATAKVNYYKNSSKTDWVVMVGFIGEVLAHELLGHGVGGVTGSKTSKHEDAIQLTNLYLRVAGKTGWWDDGAYHKIGGGLKLNIAQDIPAYLKKSRSLLLKKIILYKEKKKKEKEVSDRVLKHIDYMNKTGMNCCK